MPEQLDPITAARSVVANYRRYLKTLLPLRDAALRAELSRRIDLDEVSKGPILEITPPFVAGHTLRALMDEGLLSRGFEKLNSPALPLDRELHLHQEQALRKAIAGRNVVVATGTGSGKTESFLLPILNTLLNQHKTQGLEPGVRALLLYPMNALANDQMKRLRQVLANVPDITFGRYTGETENTREQAEATFTRLHPGETPLPNELLSRAEMRAAPPHLLLTNYAMLEYLLLRPADIELFEGIGAGEWRYVVLDEAHVYDGAKGAEIAMLLRRLTDRVSPDNPLQYIATSATVGSEPQKVVEFATRLFNAPFEFVPDDPERQDLVGATRKQGVAASWGPLTADQWRTALDSTNPIAALQSLASDGNGRDAYTMLSTERTIAKIRRELSQGPRDLRLVAREVFGDADDPIPLLGDVIELASTVVDPFGVPLLSARYHLWVRATEGAYCCLGGDAHVRLRPHEACPEIGCSRPMYEMSACSRCGTTHLKGKIHAIGNHQVLTPKTAIDQTVDWLVFTDGDATDDEDEDAVSVTSADHAASVQICADCGTLTKSSQCPGCQGNSLRSGSLIARGSHRLRKCIACGKTGGRPIRGFDSGADASSSVLATALYQELPEADDKSALLPGQGRKLLAFSDSRQRAAFFAPYLQRTYSSVQRRALLYRGLRAATESEGAHIPLDDLLDQTARAGASAGVFHRPGPPVSRNEKLREAGLWVALDLMAMDTRLALEGVGLMDITPYRDPSSPIPAPLRRLGLGSDEVETLVSEMTKTVRQAGAMAMPGDADAGHMDFAPRIGPIYIRQHGADPRFKVLAWSPARGTNRRQDYLKRVLARLGRTDDVDDLLSGLWRFMTQVDDGWIMAVPGRSRQMGTVFQLNPEMLMFRAVEPGEPAFRCSICQSIATRSLAGVCPTMRCPGTLEAYSLPEPTTDTNHYRALYRNMAPVPLSAKEHTAQWSPEEAASIQNEFVKGAVNALSCSTTFELGVDVGELQSVLLRNVPPTTANYVQRAGRAGRRSSSAALAITYADRRSHDLSMYEDPVSMIAGAVRSPVVPIENARIARRHAHSIALAEFLAHQWRTEHVQWRQAGPFFLGGNGAPEAISALSTYLTQGAEQVSMHAMQVLPTATHKDAGLLDRSWVPELIQDLIDVQIELADAVSYFDSQEQVARDAGHYRKAEMFKRVGNTYRSRDLIGYLGTKNILPKPRSTNGLSDLSGSPLGLWL